MAETVTTWTTEINREVTDIFTDFWYDLLQLSDLHRHVEDDGSGKPRVKTIDYHHALGYRRCALTENIMETNAFLSLLSDTASLAQRKSPRATEKEFVRGVKGNRAKFRCTQLTSKSTVLPPSVTQRGSNACVLIPRIHVLNFDDDQNKKTLRSLSLYTPETKFMSVDSASAGAIEASLSEVRGDDDVDPESSETRPHEIPRKRASWGWLKDRIKRAVGSDSLSPAQAIIKTTNQSVGADDAMKFDWFYNTLTKKDAANLADLVREYREVYSAADDDAGGAPKSPTLAHRPETEDEKNGEFEADVDAATALVYPIFTNSDDVVASALAEHAANVNYVALLTGITRELKAGTTRFNIVSTALHAAVLRADAAGDAKSLAHAIRIARKFQPQNTRKLWLKGSARWDDVNLWHGLISVNARVAWLRGGDPEARMGDLAQCFALVGLNCLQSSELLGQLQSKFDENVVTSSTTQAQRDGTLSAPAYTSVSFECWIEALRESGAARYGRNDHVVDLKAVPDCCPSEVIESHIWRRTAITAMCVQSGIVSSLVALGSGRGDVAFYAPDSDATSRSQPHAARGAPLTAMTFIPRSAHVFCARRDGSVEIWDSATCARLSVVRGAHGDARVSFVSPVVNQVISSVPLTASAGDDGTVKLWDARQSDYSRAVSVIKGHTGGVTAFATRDARGGAVGSVLTGDAAGVVRAWDPRHASAGPVALARAHRGKVTCLAPLQRSDSTASAGEDGVVRVLRLDGESGGDIRLSGHLGDITSLAVLQDETRGREPVGVIASGSADGELCLWSGGDLVEDARRPWRCASKSRAHVGAVARLAVESTGRARRPPANAVVNAGRGQFTNATTMTTVRQSFLSASTDGSFARWNLATARLRGDVAATSWSPAAARVPPRRASTDAVCAVIEASRGRLITGDRFGALRRVSLPDEDAVAA
jgi:WD40 repeat protein